MVKRKKTKTKRKLAHPKLPMQGQLNLRDEGTHFNLRQIFDDLNQRYFRGRLRGYKVMWGRRRKHRPREYFIFGTIQEEDRVIRINPALDQAFVPPWFLRYVLYHEMLHSVVPEEALPEGREVSLPNLVAFGEPHAVSRGACSNPTTKCTASSRTLFVDFFGSK